MPNARVDGALAALEDACAYQEHGSTLPRIRLTGFARVSADDVDIQAPSIITEHGDAIASVFDPEVEKERTAEAIMGRLEKLQDVDWAAKALKSMKRVCRPA